jgi:hypothetical protein
LQAAEKELKRQLQREIERHKKTEFRYLELKKEAENGDMINGSPETERKYNRPLVNTVRT